MNDALRNQEWFDGMKTEKFTLGLWRNNDSSICMMTPGPPRTMGADSVQIVCRYPYTNHTYQWPFFH